MDRPSYKDALARTAILEILGPFDPHVAGTPPLGLDLPSSDIDILCHAPDLPAFAQHVWAAFHERDAFTIRQWISEGRAVVAAFQSEGWRFELFGQPLAVEHQWGWRHFDVERRLLALGGAPFRQAVKTMRHAGAKTEPAFAQVLRLPGDPYRALLHLSAQPDSTLASCLTEAGFQPAVPG